MEFKGFISTLIVLICFLSMSLFITTNAFTNPEVDDESSFSYVVGAYNGPQNWGNLNPNWTLCGTGRSQSPINVLTQRVVVQPSLGQLIRWTQPSPAILKNRGHDISVQFTGNAGGILINETQYNLKDCHWHIPSEHKINGLRFDMELHLVHVNAQEDIAVVGVLYNKGSSPDPFLRQIERSLKYATLEGVNIGIVNPSLVEFKGKKYYRYNGSLTTPPCSENVIWTVFPRVKSVSKKQIQALKDAVHDGNTGNARPVQPLNGRNVYSNIPTSEVITKTTGSDEIMSYLA